MKKLLTSFLFTLSFLPILSFGAQPIRPEAFQLNYHFTKTWSLLDTKKMSEKLTQTNGNISSLDSILETKEYSYTYPKVAPIPKVLFDSNNQIDFSTIVSEKLEFPAEYTVDYRSNQMTYGKVSTFSCSLFDLTLASQFPVIGQKTSEFITQQNVLSISDTLSTPKTKNECNKYSNNLFFKFTTIYFLDHLNIEAATVGNPKFSAFKLNDKTWLFYIPTNIYKTDASGTVSYLNYFLQVSYD